MTPRLLLDEHYSDAIAVALRARGHDVVSVVADAGLRSAYDADIFRWATDAGRRIVAENIKDFRPLLVAALAKGAPFAPLLLVPPRRFPRGKGIAPLIAALASWFDSDPETCPIEDWLL